MSSRRTTCSTRGGRGFPGRGADQPAGDARGTDRPGSATGTDSIPTAYLGGGIGVPSSSRLVGVPVPTDAVAGLNGAGGLLAERGEESYIVFYAYVERRGPLGNGAFAWSLAVIDGLLGRENDYYLVMALAPAKSSMPVEAAQVSELTHILFARTAAWYSAMVEDSNGL